MHVILCPFSTRQIQDSVIATTSLGIWTRHLNLYGEPPLLGTLIITHTNIESYFRLPINPQDIDPFKKHDRPNTLTKIRTRSKKVSRSTQPIYYSSYLI